MFRKLFAWMQKYERHLATAAVLGGFAVDQVFFERIDLLQTQALFIAYVLVAAASIVWLHSIEERAAKGIKRPRFRALLPIAAQFSLGGFWSAVVFFYGHSASLAASWPFLLLLAAILVGNEYFAKYHERLVFSSVLFFFALYSYAIFEVPILVGFLGTGVFLLSGLLAALLFALFLTTLRIGARSRFRRDIGKVRAGAAVVLLVINVAYFTNVLPPLPLAAKAADIYHAVARAGDTYTAEEEVRPWYAPYLREIFGGSKIVHVVAGESLYAYSSVFAPIALRATIAHEWQRYATSTDSWQTVSAVSFPISGGRDGGYRGYSAKANLAPGRWRVNVETSDGRVVARIPFTVEAAATTTLETIALP